MTDNKTFKNLGKFVSWEQETRKDLELVVVKYTQPRYQDPTKVWSMSIPEKDISEALLEKVGNASSGEEYCFHTTKNDKGFSVLTDITEAKDAAPPAKTGWSGGSKQSYTPKDDTGIAVGAAWTNAIEILKLSDWDEVSNDQGPTQILETVDKLAWDIVNRKQAQEAKLRTAKANEPNKTVDSAQAEAPKPVVKKPSKVEEMKARKAKEAPKPVVEETIEDDDVTFDDVGYEE